MPAVTFSEVHKEFASGNVHALEGVSFEVAESELLVLLGPSGCGKTTSLRLIAGLEEPDGGEIWLGERLVSAAARNVFVQPEKRNVGMVFQSYAIWPHMTVFENVAYPLQVRRVPKHVQRQKVEQTLSLVGLQGYEKRAGDRSFRVASSSASRSPGPWSSSRSCCSWTSRSAIWTPSCGSTCAPSSSTSSSRRASPWCS